MEEVIGLNPNEDSITFTRNEWKHFINEVGMRKGQEISKCINNARYLDKLDRSAEQIKNGHVITYNAKSKFSGIAWDEYVELKKNDKAAFTKIKNFLKDTDNNSNEIDDKNRLIYEVREGVVEIKSCKGHYDE